MAPLCDSIERTGRWGSDDLAMSFWSDLVVWAASSDGVGYLGATGILQWWQVAWFTFKGSPQYGHCSMTDAPWICVQTPFFAPRRYRGVRLRVKPFLCYPAPALTGSRPASVSRYCGGR